MANGPAQELVKAGPARAPGARALLLLAAAGLALRLLLVFFGRFCLDDGFYLQNAWLLAQGERPFEDFVHVAFPVVEWLYAPVLALAPDRLAAASLVTGAAVIATALVLARLLGRAQGAAAGLAAGLLYMVAAPVLAFHQFEREIWTNLGLAAAALALLRSDAASDRRALAGGLLLGLTLIFKLTAAAGAAALLLELLLQKRARAALLAGCVALFFLAAATLLLTARYDGEFLCQTFLFYFFKEQAKPLAERGLEMLRIIDVVLALGLVGLALALRERLSVLRCAQLLMAAWLLHYLLLSPSFWDHNALDLLLPASLGAGCFAGRVLARPRPLLIAVALLALAAGARGLGSRRPAWFPHGLGGGATPLAGDQTALLNECSSASDLVLCPTPAVALAAGRRSFLGEIELEPLARGLLKEVRSRGLAAAWRRRHQGAALGAPLGTREPEPAGSLFWERVTANTALHLLPRVTDAIRAGEIALLLEPLPEGLRPALRAAGYTEVRRGAAAGQLRPRAP